jgi:hypothetical protein
MYFTIKNNLQDLGLQIQVQMVSSETALTT